MKKIDIYNDYKSQLKAYNKKLFDPFCRSHNIEIISKFNFYYEENKFIVTTIGQLNFFKWAIENDIINYISNIIEDIKQDIKVRYKSNSNKLISKNIIKNISIDEKTIHTTKRITNYSITF